jgi:hypothetical protein
MKQLKRYILIACTIAFAASGCKKALDINRDPNNPTVEQGTPQLIFPSAVIGTAAIVGGDLAVVGGIWGEYLTQANASNQYKYIDAYDINTNTILNGNVYTTLYANGLKNYQAVIDKANAAQDWNFYLMGTVMKAYTVQVLVDLYDKVPYSEALQGINNLTPKFDDGYAIYVDLLKNLDSALAKNFAATSNSVVGEEDLLFQGDMNKWKQFANTLELKMYLRMINAKPAEAQAGVQKLYNRNAQFLTSDAGVFGFKDIPGQSNPLYEQNVRQLNVGTNLRASYTFVSWLRANNDPRIVSYFGAANPNSIHQGDYLGTTATYNTAAVFVERPDDPVIFLSAAESYFLQAEARERYYGGAGAKALYDLGVLEAFASVGQNGTSFIAPGGAYEYPSGSLQQKLQAIITQKWASFPYGVHFIEGWFERNRTGIPLSSSVYSTDAAYVPGRFVTSKNSVLPAGQFPKRFPYPRAATSTNPNTPAIVPVTTPVWWSL